MPVGNFFDERHCFCPQHFESWDATFQTVLEQLASAFARCFSLVFIVKGRGNNTEQETHRSLCICTL